MTESENDAFLRLVKEHNIINNKGNTPSLQTAKKMAWNNILQGMTDIGYSGTVDKLCKRWRNYKSRATENCRKRSYTGGGPYDQLTSQDNTVLDILGENNPKVNKIPGHISSAPHTSAEVGPDVDIDDKDANNTTVDKENSRASTVVHRKKRKKFLKKQVAMMNFSANRKKACVFGRTTVGC